jgi:type VI secretion system protein ImpH
MIAKFKREEGVGPARLDVNFFGLFGPEGPLPNDITDMALRREREIKDFTLRHFFNLFTHRMLQFFYRAWADAQPVAHADRPDDDRFAFYLRQLAGAVEVSGGSWSDASEVELHWAGLFAMPTRPAEGLERVLCGYLGAPVRLQPWRGRWHSLANDELARLGSPQARLGAAVVGRRVWDCANQFRIVIGPLGLARYEELLPGGDSLERIRTIVHRWTGDELDWDLRLILSREEVPKTKLGAYGRIGFTSWLRSLPASEDSGTCIAVL